MLSHRKPHYGCDDLSHTGLYSPLCEGFLPFRIIDPKERHAVIVLQPLFFQSDPGAKPDQLFDAFIGQHRVGIPSPVIRIAIDQDSHISHHVTEAVKIAAAAQ